MPIISIQLRIRVRLRILQVLNLRNTRRLERKLFRKSRGIKEVYLRWVRSALSNLRPHNIAAINTGELMIEQYAHLLFTNIRALATPAEQVEHAQHVEAGLRARMFPQEPPQHVPNTASDDGHWKRQKS